MASHNKHVHLKIKDLLCDQCPSAFSDRIRLLRHKRIVHTKVQVKCEECGVTVSKNTLLVKHMKLVHGKDGDFACDGCDRSFLTATGLNKHKVEFCGKIEPKKEPQPRPKPQGSGSFPCSDCDKAYSHQISLDRHMKRDHDNRRYPCQHCHKVYTNKFYFKKHLIREHENVDTSTRGDD